MFCYYYCKKVACNVVKLDIVVAIESLKDSCMDWFIFRSRKFCEQDDHLELILSQVAELKFILLVSKLVLLCRTFKNIL